MWTVWCHFSQELFGESRKEESSGSLSLVGVSVLSTLQGSDSVVGQPEGHLACTKPAFQLCQMFFFVGSVNLELLQKLGVHLSVQSNSCMVFEDVCRLFDTWTMNDALLKAKHKVSYSTSFLVSVADFLINMLPKIVLQNRLCMCQKKFLLIYAYHWASGRAKQWLRGSSHVVNCFYS